MAYTRTDSALAALGALAELVPVAVVTRGRRRRGRGRPDTGEYADVPRSPVDVLDATGAGDVFGASSWRPRSAAGRCGAAPVRVLAAGLSVGRHGGALAAPGWYGVDRWWRALHRPGTGGAYGFLATGCRGPRPSRAVRPRHPARPAALTPHTRSTEKIRKAVGAVRLSRRGLLRAGLAGTAAGALGGLASGCAVPTGSTGRTMVLWYWDGGLGDTVVDKARARYDSTVDLRAVKIGGVLPVKADHHDGRPRPRPRHRGLKGEDMASYLPNANQFVDLRTLGADKYKSQYLPWKWQQGIADDGSMVGFPIDCGPVAHLLPVRRLPRRPGLPSSPPTCPASWTPGTKYFAAGETLRSAMPGTFLLTDVNSVFEQRGAARARKRYVDKDNALHRRPGTRTGGLGARRGGEAARARIQPGHRHPGPVVGRRGRQAAQPSWAPPGRPTTSTNGVPRTKGRWRVADMPVRPANNGGSFLSITRACREPERAFEIIAWMLDASNQARGSSTRVSSRPPPPRTATNNCARPTPSSAAR